MCAAHIFLGVGPSIRVWSTYEDHTLKENRLSLPQKP